MFWVLAPSYTSRLSSLLIKKVSIVCLFLQYSWMWCNMTSHTWISLYLLKYFLFLRVTQYIFKFFFRKHPTRQFWKISVLGGMVSWKIVSFLTIFSPGKFDVLMVFLSPGKSCVLAKFWTRSLGKFDLFSWRFFLLGNCMCSCGILRKLSWIFWCVLIHFASPGNSICVLVLLLVLLENLICSYNRIMSSPKKIHIF